MVVKIAAVILAAGAARRFGAPKQLLALGSTTLLGQVLDNVRDSRADRAIVVLGRSADEIEARVDLSDVQVVHNPDFEKGCGGSIQTGVMVASDADAVLMVLADQPGVTSEVIDDAIAAFERESPWAQMTAYLDGVGHPFVFGRSAYPELRALKGDKAIWKLFERDRTRVRLWPCERKVPPDVDRPEDYARLLAAWRNDDRRSSQS